MSSDFLELFGEWMVDGTQVQAPAQHGFEGVIYQDPVVADRLMIEDKQRQVRTADGSERLSTRTIYVHRDHPALEQFVLGARVIFADGRSSLVLELNDLGAYGIVDHLVVRCE